MNGSLEILEWNETNEKFKKKMDPEIILVPNRSDWRHLLPSESSTKIRPHWWWKKHFYFNSITFTNAFDSRNINFMHFFTQLKQCHYTRYLSLESPAIDNNGDVNITRLQESLNFVRALLWYNPNILHFLHKPEKSRFSPREWSFQIRFNE